MKTAKLNQFKLDGYCSFLDFISCSFQKKRLSAIDGNALVAKSEPSKTYPKEELLCLQEGQQESISRFDFINSVVHELKTPLNAIIGFSKLLEYSINDEEQKLECLDFIKEISKTALDLAELVDDLLSVGSIVSGNFSIDLSKEIDVASLVKKAVQLNYNHALKRGITIKTEIAADILTIKLDMKRMKQILANLISNAIKYSPEETEINIIVQNVFENDQKYLQFMVLDQGFGMSEPQVEIAFKKYQTIANPNSNKVDSFGLGLPITKQLTELQNGKIEVKSQVGQGTEFILKFPYL